MQEYRPGTRALLIASVCMSLLLWACSSGPAGNDIQDTGAAEPAADGGTIESRLLPDPMELEGPPATRAAHFINVVSYSGIGIFEASPACFFPADSVVIPSPEDGLEYAIYAFNTAGYQPQELYLDIVANPGSIAWLGISNFNRAAWQFLEPATSSRNYELLPGVFLSESEQLFVAVVASGGSTVTVNSITLRYDNDIETEHGISGRIIDEQGKPMSGVLLDLSPNPLGLSVTTDEEGNFSLGVESPGMHTLAPLPDLASFEPMQHELDVNGMLTGIEFTGTRIDIRGRVADAEGTGVPGVRIELSPGGAFTFTGADGEYEFRGFGETDAYIVTPLLGSYSFEPEFEITAASASDIEGIDFQATGGQPVFSLFGSVINQEDFSPAPGVTMLLNPGFRLAVTDSSGNYAFTGLSERTYELVPILSHREFIPGSRSILIEEASLTGVDFVLEPPPPAFDIFGQVTQNFADSEDIIRVEDALVELRPEEDAFTNRPDKKLTAADGSYRFQDQLEGKYRISFILPGSNQITTYFVEVQGGQLRKDHNTFITPRPSWKNFGESFIKNECSSCHRPTSQTPVEPFLTSLVLVKQAGDACNEQIQAGAMPPARPASEYYRFLFQTWTDEGFPLN